MTDDLVERVARAICAAENRDDDEADFYTEAARAAIRVALGEAVRVADGKADAVAATFYASAAGAVCAHDMARSISAAIRALIPKEECHD